MANGERRLCIGPNAPLESCDSAESTFGCRHSNSKICSNNSLENICAFVRADERCQRPPRSWKRQYEHLKNEDYIES